MNVFRRSDFLKTLGLNKVFLRPVRRMPKEKISAVELSTEKILSIYFHCALPITNHPIFSKSNPRDSFKFDEKIVHAVKISSGCIYSPTVKRGQIDYPGPRKNYIAISIMFYCFRGPRQGSYILLPQGLDFLLATLFQGPTHFL